MTGKRKRKQTAKTNVTRNRRAMADPEVESRIRDLRRRWKHLDMVERGDKLWELTAFGCSQRGLAQALRQSPTSIRRHIDLANLSRELRDFVKEGGSGKAILAAKARADRKLRAIERVRRDRETGALSDEVADVILEFCRTNDGVPEYPTRSEDLEQLLGEVETHLSWFAARAFRASPVAKRLGTKVLFEGTRPSPPPEKFVETEHRAEWLANVIWARAQERPILEQALKKAKRRAAELRPPKKTPLELFEEKRQRLIEKSRPPARRRW